MSARTQKFTLLAICSGVLLCGLSWWWLGYKPYDGKAEVLVTFVNPRKYGSGVVFARDLPWTQSQTCEEVEGVVRREFAQKRPGISNETFEVKGVNRWRQWSNDRAVNWVLIKVRTTLYNWKFTEAAETWGEWIEPRVLSSSDYQWIEWNQSVSHQPMHPGDQMMILMR
jgi:hypothetical protein